MALSDGRKSFRICFAVLIQYRSVTDTQPPSHVAVAITLNALAKASSLKMEGCQKARAIGAGHLAPCQSRSPTVIDREPDRLTRLIKEAIHIHKEGAQYMNCDEGSYQLNHAYDRFLGMSSLSSRSAKNRKN